MHTITPLDQLVASRFDTPAILKRLASASRKLAELKGIAASIPNQGILINALGLQEAKDSSEIENIVTTHTLDAGGFVQKQKIGRSNYYVNLALNRILLGNA